MPASDKQYWPTVRKHIHVLGEVRRVVHGEGTISALYLYERSVIRGEEPTELPPARIKAIIGASDGIMCTICGEELNWIEPPTEAYLRLMQRYALDDKDV